MKDEKCDLEWLVNLYVCVHTWTADEGYVKAGYGTVTSVDWDGEASYYISVDYRNHKMSFYYEPLADTLEVSPDEGSYAKYNRQRRA